MRKLICIVWVALLLFLSNVPDIGDIRAYAADWEMGTRDWDCNGTLINHNFTKAKNTYVFKGNCWNWHTETALPPIEFEVSAVWDIKTKTARNR
jgi:hypothetical protein